MSANKSLHNNMTATKAHQAGERTHEGDALRISAWRKIERARDFLDEARHDMCNLEGEGYCERWEKVGELDRELGIIASNLRTMPAPTGVFKP